MPQFIAAAAVWLIEAGIPAAVVTFAANVFVYASTTYILGRVNQALAPKQRGQSGNAAVAEGMEISYYDSGAGLRIIYGRVRVGGMETIPPFTSGDNYEYLHKVLTIAGHEVDSFYGAQFNTNTIDVRSLQPMAFTTSDGQVNFGTYQNNAWIRLSRGTSTDSADAILCSVDSATYGLARGRGIAKARVSFKYTDTLWRTGVPECTFVVQGKRCYDPRLDSSPGADPTNPSYAAWTSNGVLHTVDYLMSEYGGGYSSSDIDWTLVVIAANTADEAVNIPGSTTQPRYTFNGLIDASASFTDNLKTLVNSYLGRLTFTGGKWRVYAGSWQTPSTSIDYTDFISPVGITFENGRQRRFSRMSVWYVDPSRNWQRVQCYPRYNSTYATADFETIDAEIEQLATTSEYEAQRKGEFLLRASRNQVTVTGRLPPRMQNIALWDTVTHTWGAIGWASKTFRVTAIDMNVDASLDVVLLEEQSGDWTDLAAGDYNSASTAAIPSINPTSPSEPQNVAAYGLGGAILIDWDDPIIRPIGTRYRVFLGNSNYPIGAQVWDGDVTKAIMYRDTTSPAYFWVQAYAGDQESLIAPSTYGIGAAASVLIGVNSPVVPSSIPPSPPTITGVSNFQMPYAVGGTLGYADYAIGDDPSVQASGIGTFSYQWSVFSLTARPRGFLNSVYVLPNSALTISGVNSNRPVMYVSTQMGISSYSYINGGVKVLVSNAGGTAVNTTMTLSFWRK